ncbi:MAG TPA: YezD family protein [Sphingobium sp.]|nr:YezD family protein [Sphingobium sp.]
MSQSSSGPSPGPSAGAGDDPETGTFALVRQALDKLRFGAVHLTVHEGRLVQIEVTEKIRLTA